MNTTPIIPEALTRWSEAYHGDSARQVATLALSKTDLKDAACAIGPSFAMVQKFSIDIKTLPVTDQEKSGRCWLFSAANVLRERVAKELDLENFQLSQSYLAFWDKLERCNYFFENILETADRPTDERNVAFLLATGVHDGGQWEMFANIVRKYGLVPRDVYGETYQSSHTQSMNAVLNRGLKAGAARLRAMAADGATAEALQKEKDNLLERIYGII